MRRFLRIILVLGLVCEGGAIWGLLQSAAWAAMATRGRSAPCAVCLGVARGAASGPSLALPAQARADWAAPARVTSSMAAAARAWPLCRRDVPRAWFSSVPPLPPPRADAVV
jgi:hypothetical protein